jgi:cytochrome c oxidase subunit 3
MFFGGLFTAYLVYRNWYYPAFVAGSHQLNVYWGTLNTLVLIVSSFTMAMGVWCAQTRRRGGLVLCLTLTLLLGLGFLGIKTVEYREKIEKHHVPGFHYSLQSFVDPQSEPEVDSAYHDQPLPLDMARHTELYFSLYFLMTGMHALHMIIGIGILGFMILRARAGAYTSGHTTFVLNFGLYWHFIDIVWIYLFALLYLISRHA